jgi:hypothetical protein
VQERDGGEAFTSAAAAECAARSGVTQPIGVFGVRRVPAGRGGVTGERRRIGLRLGPPQYLNLSKLFCKMNSFFPFE